MTGRLDAILQKPGGKGLLLPGALLALSMLVHLPALDGDFTFDDFAFVEQNASLRSLGGAVDALARPFPPEDPGRGLYRPLTALSYAVDFALWGESPAGFHLANLLYYWGCCLLFLLLARRYLASPPAALAAALLFALHPVHCEAVDSVSGRSELLALLGCLAALLLFARAVERQGKGRLLHLAGALAAYAAAALCKETALLLPVILAGHLLLFRRHDEAGAKPWLLLLPFLLLMPGYLLLRAHALGGLLPAPHALAAQALHIRLLTMGVVFLEYLRLLVFPLVLQIDFYYQQEIVAPADVTLEAMVGLLLALLGAALMVQRFRQARRSRPGHSPEALGLLLFFVFLAPVSNIIPTGALMAERFLFAPSAGFVLLVVAVARRAVAGHAGRGKLAVAALAVCCLLFGARSALRSAEWQNTVTLWRPLVSRLPEDHRIWANLASGYLMYGELDTAARLARRSLTLEPGDPKALTTLGLALLHSGDLANAAGAFIRAAEVDPESPIAQYGLGEVARRRGKMAAARYHLERALDLNPNHLPSRKALAEQGW